MTVGTNLARSVGPTTQILEAPGRSGPQQSAPRDPSVSSLPRVYLRGPHLVVRHARGVDRPLSEAWAGHQLLRAQAGRLGARLPLEIHRAVSPLPRHCLRRGQKLRPASDHPPGSAVAGRVLKAS